MYYMSIAVPQDGADVPRKVEGNKSSNKVHVGRRDALVKIGIAIGTVLTGSFLLPNSKYTKQAEANRVDALEHWKRASDAGLDIKARAAALNDSINSMKAFQENLAFSKVKFERDADVPGFHEFTISSLLKGTGVSPNKFEEVYRAVRGGEPTTFSSLSTLGMEYVQHTPENTSDMIADTSFDSGNDDSQLVSKQP